MSWTAALGRDPPSASGGGCVERADVEYVRPLHLAATTSERRVEATLRAKLDAGARCDYAGVQALVPPPVPTVPVVHVPRPDLAQYDALIAGGLVG